MISFTVAHVSVVWLRHKEPDTRRPFRTPLNIHDRQDVRAGARRHRRPRHLHGVVRRRRHASLRPHHRLHLDGRRPGHVRGLPQGQGLLADEDASRRSSCPISMQADIDYDQILVPITGSRISDEMMVLGLPAGDREEVGHRRPVRDRGAAQPAARRAARQRARQGGQGAQGGRPHRRRSSRSSSRRTWSRRGRPGGRSSRRRPGAAARSSSSGRRASAASATSTFGRTTDYVLDHAPCEVLLNLVPEGLSYGGLERRGRARAAGADAARRRRRRAGRPKREGLRRVPCMS